MHQYGIIRGIVHFESGGKTINSSSNFWEHPLAASLVCHKISFHVDIFWQKSNVCLSIHKNEGFRYHFNTPSTLKNVKSGPKLPTKPWVS